jgi:Transposase
VHVGLDWAYRSAQWCALAPGGELAGEGRVAADRDGLARLVLELGDEVTARLEMTSGAAWERDELVACGRQVEVADARKVKTVAPLAAKTDKVDARLLAAPCRRQLVPALWLPSLDERTGAAGTAAPADASGAAADGREGSDLWSADAVGRPRLAGAPAPGDGLTLLERKRARDLAPLGQRVPGADRFPRRAT